MISILYLFIVYRYKFVYRGHTLVFANKGSGKTTLLASVVYKELKKMKKGKSRYKRILSNVPIRGTYKLDVHKDIGTHNTRGDLLLIDEGSIEYNNRKSMSQNQIQFHKLMRHYENDLIIISQDWEDLDVTIRRLYDKMYLANNSLLSYLGIHITTLKEIVKSIGIDEISHKPDNFYSFKL